MTGKNAQKKYPVRPMLRPIVQTDFLILWDKERRWISFSISRMNSFDSFSSTALK
ncbi:hypothetical protein B4135_3260 [Caldibacillus debilis]|uniref:Uncharacterized protein n=1 Tax=Caldibacillus debilis TaxID=301148 RepID=A0A150LFX6_9BACI|nr:hypothetical protein B4135_3260 [Caldibacillus debilis]